MVRECVFGSVGCQKVWGSNPPQTFCKNYIFFSFSFQTQSTNNVSILKTLQTEMIKNDISKLISCKPQTEITTTHINQRNASNFKQQACDNHP